MQMRASASRARLLDEFDVARFVVHYLAPHSVIDEWNHPHLGIPEASIEVMELKSHGM